MIDCSLNETASLAKLAARGVGYSWGMAEEVAGSVLWLVARGLPAPNLLLELLNQYSTAESVKDAMPCVNYGRFVATDEWLCPVAAGCALSDSCGIIGDSTRISLPDVKCPILFLPFVAELALRTSTVLAVELESDTMSTNGNCVQLSRDDTAFLKKATSIVCRKAKDAEIDFGSADRNILNQRVLVEEHVWEALGAYAHHTYAPSNKRSRALGAGAGLIDND